MLRDPPDGTNSTRQTQNGNYRSCSDPETGKLLSNVRFALHLLELRSLKTFTPLGLLLELIDRFQL